MFMGGKDNEFEIICINECNSMGRNPLVRKGQKFKINTYEYNYSDIHLRLQNLGLFEKKNFKKLTEYRKDKIFDILK